MKTQSCASGALRFTLLSLILAPMVSYGANILWVSDNGAENPDGINGAFYPAVSAGTPYVDQGFVDLLISDGHTVTRYNPDSNGFRDSDTDIATINSNYDLIIVGSATNSGPFNLNARTPKWNTQITRPMIVTKATLIRSDRMGYLTANFEYDSAANSSTTASGKLTFLEPDHPVFSGIAHSTVGSDEVMDAFSGIRIPSPTNNRGTSTQFSKLLVSGVDQGVVNLPEPGGAVLATVDFNPMDPGVDIPPGQAPAADPSYVATGYAVAEWPAGTVVRSTQVSNERLAGYRLFFNCGTRDASGDSTSAPNPQAGALDLSSEGQQMFLNSVDHALLQPAMPNRWTNAPDGTFLWDLVSTNWAFPAVWEDGADALFIDEGPGSIALDSAISAHSLTIGAPGYSFSSPFSDALILAGTDPFITANAPVTIASKIQGVDGLTIQGTDTLTLEGLNTYTGGTYVRSGTLVLNAPTTNNNASPYAVDSIEALDAGATVKYYSDIDDSGPGDPVLLQPGNGQIYRYDNLVMTGGTFDISGNDNTNQMPAPSGTGIVTNSSPYSRAVLKMGVPANATVTFSGIIQDGGPVTDSVIPGYVSHRIDVDLQNALGNAAGTSKFVMDGQNTYTGWTRIGQGILSFTSNGRWGVQIEGVSEETASPGITVICNGGITNLRVDFNGTNQTTGGLHGSGGIFANNKNGTSSTLTVGAANISNTSWPTGSGSQTGKIVDNTNGGTGIVALTKIGTGTIGIPTAQNTYSGPTTIHEGILEFTATGAPSPNSDIQMFGTGQLALSFGGNFNANGFYIDGVRQPDNVTVNATNYPGVVTGGGTINIVPTHASIIPTVTATRTGGNVEITWIGSGILQTSPDLINWTDIPGASTPWTKPAPDGKEFYRLRQ